MIIAHSGPENVTSTWFISLLMCIVTLLLGFLYIYKTTTMLTFMLINLRHIKEKYLVKKCILLYIIKIIVEYM